MRRYIYYYLYSVIDRKIQYYLSLKTVKANKKAVALLPLKNKIVLRMY